MHTISNKTWEVGVTETAWEGCHTLVVRHKKSHSVGFDLGTNDTLDHRLTVILREFDNKYKDYASCVQLKEILEQLFPQLDASTVKLLLLDTSLYEQYIEEWNAENLSAEELYGMENLASEHVPKS